MADSLELTPTPFSISVISGMAACVPLVATQSKISGAMLAFAAMPAGSLAGANNERNPIPMSDKKRQKPTLTTVTPKQELAIDVLASGGTTDDAAEAAKVTRQTVSKWRNHHPGFRAELNTRRLDLNHERADRIRDLDAQALATVANAIEEGDTAAALAWVKARQLHTVNVDAVGSIDAEAIIDKQATMVRKSPEHSSDPLYTILEFSDCKLSHDQAVELVEAELTAALE